MLCQFCCIFSQWLTLISHSPFKSQDPKQARKIKREKYAQQRKLDGAKRIEVTKQRKALYELIQNDAITTIFNARAHGPVSDAPGWGQQNEAEMAALNEQLNSLTASLAGTAEPATLSASNANAAAVVPTGAAAEGSSPAKSVTSSRGSP